MTTDNRTNELTADQILVDEWIRQADRAKSMTGMDAIWFPDAEETLAVLRANGLLSEGAPCEEQIERAARAIRADYVQRYPEEPPVYHAGAGQPVWRHMARAALVAAQGAARPVNGFDTTAERVKTGADSLHVAPREPNQNETKSGSNFVSLDPEQVAAQGAARQAHYSEPVMSAPQVESEDNVMCRCGHGTGSHDFSDPQEPCREIVCDCRGWFGVSPVLPSSGVDEDALAEVTGNLDWGYMVDGPSVSEIARAVVEWLKGQER